MARIANQSWRVHRFDEMAIEVKDRVEVPRESGFDRYVGLEHLDSGSLKICRWGSTEDVEKQKMLFKSGDIIFGRRNAYLRRVAVADFDGVCSAHAMVLRAHPDVVLPEFLPFFMQTELFWQAALRNSAGSLSPTINWSNIAKEEFALPPLEEQREISECLTATESLRTQLFSLAQEAETLRKATRHSLFTPASACGRSCIGPDSSSHHWDVRPLGDLFELLDSRRIPLKEEDRKSRQGPYPYYGASGPIDSIDDYIFDEATLLLAEDGMNLVFRNAPIVYKATGKYWVNNHAHVLRPRDGVHIDFYLEYLEYVSYLPHITGTYQKKITRADCEAIPLLYPPFKDQEEMAELFKKFDDAEEAIAKRGQDAKALQTSALAKVVNGR